MGLARDEAGLWVATFNRIWRFGFLTGTAAEGGKHDAYLVPQVALMTGYVNAHDLAIATRGQPVFAASMFNCIATTNNSASFTPVWYPSFITDRAPRDACHLNGIALDKGKLRFATVLSQSNEPGAWRKDLAGGAIVDVVSNVAVVDNLAQPHSPRIYKGRLWLHESGKGVFGTIDKGRFRGNHPLPRLCARALLSMKMLPAWAFRSRARQMPAGQRSLPRSRRKS